MVSYDIGSPDEYLPRLRFLLDGRFSLDDLSNLCFDLGIDPDELEGSTKAAKVRGLIEWLKHRERLDQLLQLLGRTRPDVLDDLGLSPTPLAPASPAGPLPAPPTIRHTNLPIQPTPFIGRQREVLRLQNLLLRPDVRLVTLVGPGGTGKTRLALEVAGKILSELVADTELNRADTPHALFSDGVWFVSLSTINDPNVVASTIAHTLGVLEVRGRAILKDLQENLRDKWMLLLLDNFEQVVAAAPLVAELLTTCPRLKLLITSRASLHIQAEHEFPVPPLMVPDRKRLPPAASLSQYDAVALFIERAVAVNQDFAVTNENAPAVAEICAQLDGLPLAIELAAARVKLLPPQALLARLSRRLKLLTGGARDLPARQQTMRNTIAWSYDLLNPAEKQLFQRLSVFVGGCTLAAAAAVCNSQAVGEIELLDGLARLVDESLLRQQEEPGGEPRFSMLETIRDYGLEQLAASGEEPTIRQRHAEFFLNLAVQGEREIRGPQQVNWLDRLEIEHDNLRAVLEGCQATGAVDNLLRLAGALSWFWSRRGYFIEGRGRLDSILAISADVVSTDRGKALYGAGSLAALQSDYATARLLLEQSVAIFRQLGDAWHVALALSDLGFTANHLTDRLAARQYLAESIALFRSLGERWGLALALNNLGHTAYVQGEYASAQASYSESRALFEVVGDKWGIADTLSNLGLMAYYLGDFTAARHLHEDSLAIWRELGDKRDIAAALGSLGYVGLAQGDYASATAFFEDSLNLHRELGSRGGIALALNGLGEVARCQGDYPRAEPFYTEALSIRRQAGHVGVASILSNLGYVRLYRGDPRHATELFTEALNLYRARSHQVGAALCIVGFAAVASRARQPERAARLLGAVDALLEQSGTRLEQPDGIEYDRTLAAVKAQQDNSQFMAAYAAGHTLSFVEAVAFALEACLPV